MIYDWTLFTTNRLFKAFEGDRCHNQIITYMNELASIGAGYIKHFLKWNLNCVSQ